MDWRHPSWPAALHRVSLAPAAIAFIGGAALHAAVPQRPVTWLVIAGICLLLATFSISRPWLSSSLILSVLAFLGLADAQLQLDYFPANHIGQYVATDRRLTQLRLRLTDTPRLITGEAELRKLFDKQVGHAQVLAVRASSGWIDATGDIALTIEPPNTNLRAGESIEAIGWLSAPLGADNPGEFDYAAYDRRQRILADFQIRRAGALIVLNPTSSSWLLRARANTQRLLKSGFDPQHQPAADLLDLVLLGDANQTIESVRDDFVRLGVAYQLSISGLHIAVMGALVLWLGRLLRLRPRWSVACSAAAMLGYAGIALPTQGGVRSLIMAIVGIAVLVTRRRVQSIQLLSLAVLAMLIVRPLDIEDAGFQVSVMAVLGIILLAPPISRFLNALWTHDDDPWAVSRRRNQPAARQAFRAMLRGILNALAVSTAAWIFILPVMTWQFAQTNPWATPAGLLLLPVTLCTLFAAAAKVLLTAMMPWGAHALANVCGLPAVMLQHSAGVLSHLPGASHPMPRPAGLAVAVFYALVLASFLPISRARWLARALPFLACIGFILFPRLGNARQHPDSLRATFLSIGAGQVAFIETPYGENFFIDCGSTTVPDVYKRVIEPFLRYQGITHVDEIFLSHGDYDHISAATEIARAFGARDIRMTPFFAPHAKGVHPAEAVLAALNDDHREQRLDVTGDALTVGDGARLDVLWPPAGCTMNSNDCGMVLRLTYAGRSILFPADIQVQPELALDKHPDALHADVLVAPHHGSAETSTAAFLNAVSPRWIVASNAGNLTHKQKVFDELAKKWPSYRTSAYGAITVELAADGQVNIHTFKNP